MKLNTQEIFDDWARKVQQRNLGVSGRIFTIESARVRGRTGNVLKLKVNFLPEIITLSKEVRNLKWLGFRVPLAIVNKAHQANQLYPFAISLIESVRTYERTCEKVEERNTISLLVAGLKKEVQALIAEGIALVWESYKLDPYVQRLAETVFNFQEKVGVHYELTEEEKFYRNALTRMPDGPVALEESYSAVMGIVTEVEQYVKVQSKVNLKYDSWHKEVLSKFGQMLGTNMTEFHSQISKSRQELEQHSVDTASTSDAVTFITYVQSLKRKIKQFEKQVELYRNGQRLLEKQRFQFPPSWLYIDNIEGEWGAFNDIMRRKDSAIQQQVANLQMKIVQEDRAVESRTTDLLTDWEKTKPVTGNLRPEEALQALTIYEGKFGRLKDDREKCAKAKEALELTDTGLLSGSEERVQLRQNLDGLLNQLKNFPARLRQYASYEFVQRLLKGYMKIREVWNTYELDLVNYQNKCRLIRGWDDLFNKVKEHINSVSAMKLSPYYKVFEEDALSWEDKLNRIMALFDVWIDVQRRWVYLEGIFTGSADIKHLLPVETQRFQSISTEFLALMKKVSKSPLVMDVLNIQGVQRSLERLADLLGKIQKALGEYLERERSSFPR
ncbi:Cytoplasmic dynein 1 heavy chain 1 [Microtus ochrogaster]|uniref:Cytoplasmic dynein 1 heavy chain 1 n=1 Tax=Microtus ochrogaster TaxID=79684 RepID=A0A8J6FX68_MICOH|nr:Cytoplasmic dynein 1 heavy chain 1 [Microtus ochrogaster]